MGLILVLIGIVVLVLWSTLAGALLILVGVILMFVPAVPYGYSDWRGRRGPPP